MKIAAAFLLAFSVASISHAQSSSSSGAIDTAYSYMPIRNMTPDSTVRRNALGLNLMIGNSGFGFGVFYRQHIDGTLSWTLSWNISEAKAPNEVAVYNYFTGQKFVPGKINQLFTFPLTVGLQYRLFKNELTNSFRPYVFVGAGPNGLLASPYDQPLSWSLSHSHTYIGAAGDFGIGAYFGVDPNSLIGASISYYILAYPHGVQSMQGEPMANFNSFFIGFNIATQF